MLVSLDVWCSTGQSKHCALPTSYPTGIDIYMCCNCASCLEYVSTHYGRYNRTSLMNVKAADYRSALQVSQVGSLLVVFITFRHQAILSIDYSFSLNTELNFNNNIIIHAGNYNNINNSALFDTVNSACACFGLSLCAFDVAGPTIWKYLPQDIDACSVYSNP